MYSRSELLMELIESFACDPVQAQYAVNNYIRDLEEVEVETFSLRVIEMEGETYFDGDLSTDADKVYNNREYWDKESPVSYIDRLLESDRPGIEDVDTDPKWEI